MKPLPELIQRIYTAIPLVAIAVAATFYFDFISFVIIDTLLISFLGWEWIRISGYMSGTFRYFYIFILWIACLGVSCVPVQWVGSLSVFMGILLAINFFVSLGYGQQAQYPKWLLAILGGIYLVLAWYALCFLKGAPIYLGMGLLIVVLTDTLAYIVGKRWGYHRLAPNISPNKTWEGCLAGLLGPVFVVLVIDKLSGYPFYVMPSMAIIIIFTTLAAVAGDLFESAIKRQSGLKDSGCGLPGHGGWLDRFDSLVCAIPVFSAGLLYLATF